MKKILLLLVMFFMVGAYQAQDTTTYVTDSKVEKLVDKYSGKLEAVIVSLAETLQQPAEHVYEIMVRQQYVKLCIGLFILFIIILFTSLTFKYANNVKDWNDLEVYDNKPKYSGEMFIVFGILSCIFFGAFFIAGYPRDIIQGIINPEFSAIHDILKLIK